MGLTILMDLKNKHRGKRVSEYCQHSSTAVFHEGKLPWETPNVDFAFPCAHENELDGQDALSLAAGGCRGVFEGANMPCTPEAGGVAVSGLEMAQNAQLTTWTREEVEAKLQRIMKDIYQMSASAALEYTHRGDLKSGANIAGFLKVANAMIEQGSA